MATSQYSLLRQYTPYTSPYNIDLIKDVMVYKQGKVDANREKMYDQIDYLMGQEIAKPQDRAYFESRMHDAISRINRNYKGADLSTDGVVRNIQGEISTVLDDKVLNAIAGTKEYKNLQKQIDYIRTNKPEAYSPINEFDAERPYLNWLNDGQTGSRLGSLRYVPYVDYKGNMAKRLQEFRKNNKGKKINQPVYDKDGNPTGIMYEMTVDQMTEHQIYNHIVATTSESEREQMRIEARYLSATSPMFGNMSTVDSYMSGYEKRYKDQLGMLETQSVSAGENEYLKTNIENSIQSLKNRRRDVLTEIEAIKRSGDPNAAAEFIVRNNYYDGMMSTWSYDNTSYLRKKDEGLLAVWEEQRKREKDAADIAMKAAEGNAKIKKDLSQAELNISKAMGKVSSSSKSSSPGSERTTLTDFQTAVTDVGFSTKTEDAYKDALKIMNENNLTIRKQSMFISNRLQESGKLDGIIKEIENLEKNGKISFPSGTSSEEKVYEYLRRNGGVNNSLVNGDEKIKEAFNKIKNAKDIINPYIKPFNEIGKYQDEIIDNRDNNEYIEGLFVNEKYVPEDKKYEIRGLFRREDGKMIPGLLNISDKEAGIAEGRLLALAHAITGVTFFPISAPGGYGITSNGVLNYGSYLTNTTIEKIKEMYGESFNNDDYINSDGSIKKVDNLPGTIRLLKHFAEHPIKDIRKRMHKLQEEANDNGKLSEIVAKNRRNNSYLAYSFSKEDSDPDVKDRRATLASIYNTKRGIPKEKGIADDKVYSAAIHRLPKEGGGFKNILVLNNNGIDTGVEISDKEMIDNKFPTDFASRNYHIDDVDTLPYSCTLYGGIENERQYKGTEYEGLSSKKAMTDNIIENLLSAYSMLDSISPEEKEAFRKHVEAIVNVSDYLNVSAKGNNKTKVTGEPDRYLTLSFRDNDDYNPNSDPVISSVITINGEYADEEIEAMRSVPQFYLRNAILSAYSERLAAIITQSGADQLRLFENGQFKSIGNDELSKIEKFLISKR